LGYLGKYIKKYYGLFLLAILFLSVEAFCDLLQPTIMSKIVDVGISNRDLRYVLEKGALMLTVTGLGALGAVGRNNLSSRVSQQFGTELRFDLFAKIQTLSCENAGKFDTASLVTRLTNDVIQTQNFVNGTMRVFVKAPLLCLGSIVMAVVLEPRLSPIIAVTAPAVILIVFLNTRVSYPRFRKVQRAIDGLNGMMREYLSGVRVIKAFNRFDFEKARFARANEALVDVQVSAMKTMAVFSPLSALVINLGIVAVLWAGGYAVDSGTVEVGRIIAFINYMTQMLGSLMMLSRVFAMYVRARASTERIGDVMNTEETIPKARQPVKEAGERGLAFRDVSFFYSGNRNEPVLKHVSFSLKPGETLGIIGMTGSGKTSIINLIPRFYDVSSGAVLVNGTDVRDVDEHALRDKIAVVPQKNTLFTGSILDNIRWGNKNADMEDVIKAAEVAQAHPFISAFPEGYETILGQGGVNLSGGQKATDLHCARARQKAGDPDPRRLHERRRYHDRSEDPKRP